ncbi:hypothetical protein T01_8505 [Trichinella spiralis]|uniref:Secreted protein n=1 Tax=Trichinella spiralis TaxID=6334 RepID=A0A0V1BR25_TRISP|nr:hypothetical protein T01_8505 [Trichinella spiralis]
MTTGKQVLELDRIFSLLFFGLRNLALASSSTPVCFHCLASLNSTITITTWSPAIVVTIIQSNRIQSNTDDTTKITCLRVVKDWVG